MSDAIYLDELAAGLSRRSAVLAPESALFIVFEALEALGPRSAVITPSDVRVSSDGVVSLGPTLDAAVDETSVLEGAVETLEAVLDPVPMGVSELSLKVRSSQIISRGALLSELAAMLVPLNRRAARRLVSRLVRECARPVSAVASTAPADDAIVERELARLAGDEAESSGVHDTVLDGRTMAAEHDAARTSLDGRLPDGWGDDRAPSRRSSERRNAWVAMALAAVALVAAALFLLDRVRSASA